MNMNLKGLFKRTATMTLVIIMVLSLTTTGVAAQETWNKGQKASFVPSSSDTTCSASNWTKNLVDLYQLKWYENPTRQVLKGEFMLVQLRTIQASLERRGLDQLSTNKETLDFKDNNTLTESAQEEAKILKYLGILSGTAEGYMNLTSAIKRSEAAKVLAITNSKVLDIPSIRNPKAFNDIKGHWAEESICNAYQISLLNGMSDTTFNPDEALTLEQTLQILENEIGYFGITREDVAKAMNETFKVTLNTELSNSINTNDSNVMEGDTINTNPENVPSNASLYPYILSNVDKSVYELPFFLTDNRSNLSPKELYVYKKDSYPQIKMWCEEYFNELLNIDYRTITEESLRAKIEPYYIFDASDATVKKYVQHVKDNQIVLTGSSQVQFPVVYFDGSAIRVRMRLQFEVVSSNTKDSLIYLDMLDGLKETYTKKSYNIIVDCSMSSAIGNNNLYINEVRLYKGILDKPNCGIVKEVEK